MQCYSDIGVDEIIILDIKIYSGINKRKAVADYFMNAIGRLFRQ